MREWTVRSGEKDQRFNKYLQRRLPGAPSNAQEKEYHTQWQKSVRQ